MTTEVREFSRASHFCAAASCRFGMTTVVNGYIVSSVGDYHPGGCDEMRAIGSGRFFETYVFRLDRFCDAANCACGLPIPADWTEIDAEAYQTEEDARVGHAAVVAKYAEVPR